MVDPTEEMIVAALRRAAAAPAGAPLLATRTVPGLFPASAAARQLARRCKDDGLLQVLSCTPAGKSQREICGITEQGLSYLVRRSEPRDLLRDLAKALEARQAQWDDVLVHTERMRAELGRLRTAILEALQRLSEKPAAGHSLPAAERNGSPSAPSDWHGAILEHLRKRQEAGAIDDCSLPELYRVSQRAHPALTIGRFHDGLRQLHERQQIYLHPWTGPLHELPEPSCALLVGHEIAYYASRK